MSGRPPPPTTPPPSSRWRTAGDATTWWLVASGAAGLLALIGLLDPATAMRVLLIVVLGLAAAALARSVMLLFGTVSTAPATAVTDRDHVTRRSAPALPTEPAALLPFHIAILRPDPSTAATADREQYITPGARAAMRTIATERIWQQHRLNLWIPAHGPAIRPLLSNELWEAVQWPVSPGSFIRQHRLGGLLDELEQL